MPRKPTTMAASIAKFDEQWESTFGEPLVQEDKPYEVISTGSLELDLATGIGGLPMGRSSEHYGEDDGGKTFMALVACAQAQKQYPDRLVGYVDPEAKADTLWAKKIGVDLSRWRKAVPRTSEETADAVKAMLQGGVFSLIVIDSIGAMMAKVEREKRADEDTVAITARIVTRMMGIINSIADEQGSHVYIINQLRSEIGSFGPGPKTTRPGGRKLRHTTTMRMKYGRTSKKPLTATIGGESGIPVAKEIAIKVERNKCAPAGAVANLMIYTTASPYGPVGVDNATAAFKNGKKLGVLDHQGTYYTLPNGLQVRGEAEVIQTLKNDPTMIDQIRTLCLAQKTNVVLDDDAVTEEQAEEETWDGETGEFIEPVAVGLYEMGV